MSFPRSPLLVLALLGATAGCAKDPDESPFMSGDGGALCAAEGGVAPPLSAADAGAGLNCATTCDFPGGVTVGCATRFQYGVNYAWNHFGLDFGGAAGTGSGGVASDCTGKVANDLADIRANGADVVRWWVWPRLGNGGVLFDASGVPLGLGPTTVADLEAALDLAARYDLHVQPCLFSFDNFRASTGAVRGLEPIITDPQRRAALVEQAVRPFVRAASASPHADRVVSWDVINEPEWAMSGQNPYGDPAYTPQTNLQQVSHADMEAFVAAVIAAIREESPLPITVGSAGAKWPKAWSNVSVDFYTIHLYDWLNAQYPYSSSPAQLGYTGKPVVVGEFPLGGLTGVPYAQLLDSWYANGYAGALAWAVTDRNFNWPANKAGVKSFADGKGCAARY